MYLVYSIEYFDIISTYRILPSSTTIIGLYINYDKAKEVMLRHKVAFINKKFDNYCSVSQMYPEFQDYCEFGNPKLMKEYEFNENIVEDIFTKVNENEAEIVPKLLDIIIEEITPIII